MADKTILNIGNSDGKTSKFILEADKRTPLYGLKVGSEIEGDLLADELSGYVFKITGGSDEDGVPMRADLDTSERKRILFKGRTAGYKPKKGEKGIRRRKLVRGAEVQDDIAQLNLKVIKAGKAPIE